MRTSGVTDVVGLNPNDRLRLGHHHGLLALQSCACANAASALGLDGVEYVR